ncbi:aminotransferase class I/II-fold pyridoxal phosphate-dependent enzyme [Streptomyces shenzhenensis]|uniref:aminotransferase class I/II-fold pyridoxal phosphate-dependent enzyme n=1 Tax=Streptomyces shenzhenensis TaxID=943815 RepID=UPI001F3D0D84|nr:aminotransferase class I/II-fold pyridoxal phosphate-dependent enzyme [Streptomyces shenzhenensis]
MRAPEPRTAGANMFTLADYATAARTVIDPAIWDFVEGGAGEERTLAANQSAFDRVRLRPRVLAGVGRPDIRTEILGRTWPVPVGIAPMAYHTLVHPAGEVVTALAAGPAGVPLVVSTFAGRTLEEISWAASSPLWLQIYCFRDRSVTRGLIERAELAGFEALVLTVDAPRLGNRLRDLRNDFRLPPRIAPANLAEGDFSAPSSHALAEFDPSLDWSVLEWIRSITSLPVLIKGVLTASDARRAVVAGADGIVVSNHGGRQLDGSPATVEVLSEIAAAVAGECAVLLDGGIRRGVDVLAALALGADAVMLGRPVLHGLAVGQERGVADILGIITDEFTDAMLLTGTARVADARPELVELSQAFGQAARTAPSRRTTDRTIRPDTGLHKEDLHSSVSDPALDTMNFLNEVTHRYPDAISFAPGRPYDGFFETEDIFRHIRRYLDHLEASGASADEVRSALFQYGPTSGQIRELIADWIRRRENIDVPPESIVVTVGCQEAMLLAVRALIAQPEDVLLVSSPCYVGITGVARLLGVELVEVEGLSCADLEAVILAERARGRRPRAFYVVPDHSNPSGSTMPLEARHELLETASRHGLLILEDSPYRLVSPGEQLPTLKSLDHASCVVHLSSLSKTLFPGARVGFVIADQPVVDAAGHTSLLADELTKIKSMVTVNTSPVSQAVVAGMLLEAGDQAAAERDSKRAAYYGDAMRSTLRHLEKCFPAEERDALGVRWNEPSGGFFLAVDVPFRADEAALMRSAQEFGVIWTPMSYFHPDGGGEHSLRLSVSYVTDAEIAEGVKRLARFIRAQTASSSTHSPAHRKDGRRVVSGTTHP